MPFLRGSRERRQLFFFLLILLISLPVCLYAGNPELIARSRSQWTGVAVTGEGRLFVSFPAWGKGFLFSLGEVAGGEVLRFEPRDRKTGERITLSNAQSLRGGAEGLIWILDNANPDFKGVRFPGPRLLAVDVESGLLVSEYRFSKESYKKNSYLNDFCICTKQAEAYVSDSGTGGIVVMDLESGESRRYLDGTPSVTAETSTLNIGGSPFRITSHVNGIALDKRKGALYYSALSGHTLYRIPVSAFQIPFVHGALFSVLVEPQGRIPASDGMIIDLHGRLWITGVETGRIWVVIPHQGAKDLFPGFSVSWPDSLAEDSRSLYLTSSDIQGRDGFYELYRLPLSRESQPSEERE